MVAPAQESERRSRHAAEQHGRHRGAPVPSGFERGFQSLGELAMGGAQVSARATDLATGRVLFSVDDHVVMPMAGVGTVLLLIEVASRLRDPDFGAYTILDRSVSDNVTGSGLWQHLQAPSLPVADLAALIGATNDGLATNVLLRAVGLEAVRRRTDELGLARTGLLDLVRDNRGPDDAPNLSIGSANELTWLFTALARGEILDEDASERVLGWLSLNSDLSMVASAFGFSPHSHREPSHGVLLVNRTGTDTGVRSEVGVLRGPRAGVAYAVSVFFEDHSLSARLSVLDGMRSVGLDLLEYVH